MNQSNDNHRFAFRVYPIHGKKGQTDDSREFVVREEHGRIELIGRITIAQLTNHKSPQLSKSISNSLTGSRTLFGIKRGERIIYGAAREWGVSGM